MVVRPTHGQQKIPQVKDFKFNHGFPGHIYQVRGGMYISCDCACRGLRGGILPPQFFTPFQTCHFPHPYHILTTYIIYTRSNHMFLCLPVVCAYLSLLSWPLWTHSLLIIGWWSSNPEHGI